MTTSALLGCFSLNTHLQLQNEAEHCCPHFEADMEANQESSSRHVESVRAIGNTMWNSHESEGVSSTLCLWGAGSHMQVYHWPVASRSDLHVRMSHCGRSNTTDKPFMAPCFSLEPFHTFSCELSFHVDSSSDIYAKAPVNITQLHPWVFPLYSTALQSGVCLNSSKL